MLLMVIPFAKNCVVAAETQISGTQRNGH